VLELRDVPADSRDTRRAETLARAAARRAVSRWLDPVVARAQVEEHADRTAATSAYLDVVVDGEVVGALWLGRDGDELLVFDAVLDRPGSAAALTPVLVQRARTEGASMVGIGVQPGDVAQATIAATPGFRVRATNMALELTAGVPDSGGLTLRPMTPEEFRAFTEGEVEDFADELASAGADREQALERSRVMFGELLPSGQDSPGMEFHVAEAGGEAVGELWLSTADPMAFVYNIVVHPEHRRRGHGAAIMDAAARRCHDLGHPVLGLNVVSHNPGARALYDRLGYRVTHDYYALDVPDGG
jgi:ribosomal protein S18 acetylase RimI-like enzyme